MSRKSSPVWRLLRRNISSSQLVGYALANFVGLTIVLAAIQFYTDVNSAYKNEDSTLGRDYLIISHKIEHLGARANFTDEELAEIKTQPWVIDMGRFTPSRFESMIKVNLSGGGMIGSTGYDMPSRGISTDAFFETVPDKFFDRLPEGWDWQPADSGKQPRVPIVLSKDYLTLFNFGFATSFGLPTISESTVAAVPLSIVIEDGYDRIPLEAYIAGFSSRINTITVPETFMTWANDKYGSPETIKGPARIILETDDPGNPEIKKFLDEHKYEVAGDKMNGAENSYFLKLITSIVIGVGIIISALAFFILMLSIFLLVQKSREKLRDLILLGYTPGSVAVYYYRMVAVANAVVIALSVLAVLTARTYWLNAITSVNARGGSMSLMIAIAIAVLLLLTVVNVLVIRRLVARAGRA